MLREAGKRDRRRLLAFLDRHAATAPRILLRYAIEHLDSKERARYLNLRGTAGPDPIPPAALTPATARCPAHGRPRDRRGRDQGRTAGMDGAGVLTLPTFVVAIDLFVLLLALPSLSADLGADGVQQLWVMDIYGFLLAGFTMVMGTLGDRIGRRKLLMGGAAAFAATSLLCAYATGVWMLVAARVLLGIARAALGPATLALIGNIFKDPRQKAAAFGVWGGVYTLGALVGPVIGGALLARFWWGSVFLLGPPVMAVALIVGGCCRRTRGARRGGWT